MKAAIGICTAALIVGISGTAFAGTGQEISELLSKGPGVVSREDIDAALRGQQEESVREPGFDVNRFVLPQEAAVLVVVEGTSGSACNVYAYEKEDGAWAGRVSAAGYLGLNGMSSNRTMGDKTTPIGVFQMNTPFGQREPLSGFPSNYIQVDESYVWEDDSNRLTRDLTKEGEKVGTAGYRGYYDYVLDFGYNRNAVAGKGSALFLHCEGDYKGDTSGCVAIKKEEMIKIMRLYGTYGDGRCYIALAPQGTFDLIYDAYGTNSGLSPEGDFGGSGK